MQINTNPWFIVEKSEYVHSPEAARSLKIYAFIPLKKNTRFLTSITHINMLMMNTHHAWYMNDKHI